jgi:hypothetical protein
VTAALLRLLDNRLTCGAGDRRRVTAIEEQLALIVADSERASPSQPTSKWSAQAQQAFVNASREREGWALAARRRRRLSRSGPLRWLISLERP